MSTPVPETVLEIGAGQSPALRRLQTMSNAIVPAGMAVICRTIGEEAGQLFPEEELALRNASARRQAEFTAGRVAARAALQRLGGPAFAIPMGSGGSPIWPTGFVGSISHCRSAAIAVVASCHGFAGHIGIDVEEAELLDGELWGSICTASEINWLAARPEAGLWAKTLFCIKEAAFKAHYPLTRRSFDFQDFEVSIDVGLKAFTVRMPADTSKLYAGRFESNDAFIVTFAAAPSLF